MTLDELAKAKTTLADDLDANEVSCYGNVIPAAVPTDPESLKVVEVFAKLAEKMPFALISSTEVRDLSPFLLLPPSASLTLLYCDATIDPLHSGKNGLWAGVLMGQR